MGLETLETLIDEDRVQIKVIKYQNKVYISKSIKNKHKNSFELQNEWNILQKLHHSPCPLIIKAHFFISLTQPSRRGIVLDYLQGGDLLNYMRTFRLSTTEIRDVAIQLIYAIKHIHSLNIIHRDIKLSNICITANGTIRLIDFGSAVVQKRNQKIFGRAGTDQYMAPAILQKIEYGREVDWWSFGVSLYYLKTSPSYKNITTYCPIRKTVKTTLEFGTIKDDLEDLISMILTNKESSRLTTLQQITSHKLFEGINWNISPTSDRFVKCPLPLFLNDTLDYTYLLKKNIRKPLEPIKYIDDSDEQFNDMILQTKYIYDVYLANIRNDKEIITMEVLHDKYLACKSCYMELANNQFNSTARQMNFLYIIEILEKHCDFFFKSSITACELEIMTSDIIRLLSMRVCTDKQLHHLCLYIQDHIMYCTFVDKLKYVKTRLTHMSKFYKCLITKLDLNKTSTLNDIKKTRCILNDVIQNDFQMPLYERLI